MRHKRLQLIAVLLLVIGLTRLQAQETIPAIGGNASGSGGSVSYSVGQAVYTTNTGTNGSVPQGVQQPFEISVETGNETSIVISNFVPATYFVKVTDSNKEVKTFKIIKK